MVEHWDLSGVLGYLRSWSATGRFVAARGESAFGDFAERLAEAWGEPTRRVVVRWPLAVLLASLDPIETPVPDASCTRP